MRFRYGAHASPYHSLHPRNCGSCNLALPSLCRFGPGGCLAKIGMMVVVAVGGAEWDGFARAVDRVHAGDLVQALVGETTRAPRDSV